LIINGTFQYDISDWTNEGSGNDWAYSSGKASCSFIGAGSSKILTQSLSLPSKCEFTLSFDLASDALDSLEVYVNGENYETFDQIGSLELTITSKKPITSIGFKATANGAGTFTIDNVSMPTDICSDCFDLKTEHECSYLLESTNSHDAFGFEFDNFTMYQRLYSDLFKYSPQFDQVLSKSSAGINEQVFGDLQKIYELKVYRIPKYVIDAIFIMIILNTVYVDGEQYIKNEGAVELDWDNKREYASCIIELLAYSENNQNTYS
jgi:hypothetical protein